VRIESAELTSVAQTQYHADLVVLLVGGIAVLGIVVEVQLQRDPDKRRTWPVYLTSLGARIACPVSLLVITSDNAVAKWAAEEIRIGLADQFVLRPWVIGPDAIPFVTDRVVAQAAPELAVLSAMAHGKEAIGAQIGEVALAATMALDESRQKLYADLVLMALSPEALAKAFERLGMDGTYEYQSEFAKRYVSQGKVEGKAEGRAEGKAEGKAEGIVLILQARGLQLSSEQRQSILRSTNFEQLDEWLRLALTVAHADELFVTAD